jgi:hypothetical protein
MREVGPTSTSAGASASHAVDELGAVSCGAGSPGIGLRRVNRLDPPPRGARAATSASASPDPSSSPASGSAIVRGRDLKAVDWEDVTAPGAACFATRPIELHNGYALLHHRTQRPALLHRPYSLDLETTRGVPEVTYAHPTSRSQ